MNTHYGNVAGYSQCQLCGAWYLMQHYCGGIAPAAGAQPAHSLTEEDVRRIVREEIARSGVINRRP